MRPDLPLLCAILILALAACEEGKPRHVPPDPMAIAPPPPGPVAPPTEGLSAGLAKRAEVAGASIDSIGAAADPLSHQPAVTPAGQPTMVQGFGFDPAAKAPGKGLDVVVDGKLYGATYGTDRPDVAAYFKTPGLAKVGFHTTLPAGVLAVGPHLASVRVVAADGKGYFESVKVAFEVKAGAPGPPR
jgi:hypothetical protein